MQQENKIDFSLMGASLFVIVFYAPFTIGAILCDKLCIQYNVVVSVAFLLMALGTAISARYTKHGLVLAPGIGLASFFSYEYASGHVGFYLPLASLIASLFTCIISASLVRNKKSIRAYLLDKFNPSLKIGICASVGAMLAGVGLAQIIDSPICFSGMKFSLNWNGKHHIPLYTFIIFIVAVIILTISARMAERIGDDKIPTSRNYIIIICRLMHIITPTSIFLIYFLTHPMENAIQFNLNGLSDSLCEIFTKVTAPSSLFTNTSYPTGFLAIVGTVFLLTWIIAIVAIVDIAGSPYEMLRTSKSSTPEQEIEERIGKAFIASSCASAVNALFLLSPSVYYAENHIMTQAGTLSRESKLTEKYVTNPSTAVFCSIVFFAFSILLLFVHSDGDAVVNIIKFSVAPNLFCLGLHLTAKSLVPADGSTNADDRVHKFMPAALSIILVSSFGFDFAIISSILYSAIINIDYRFIQTKEFDDIVQVEVLFFICSLAALLVLFASSCR